MTVAVVGAGAMGGMLANRLTSAGQEVVLVDVNHELVDTINSRGLLVDDTKAGSSNTIHPRATSNPAEIGPVDTVVFFVKGYHTGSAVELAKPLVDEQTTVCTLQNGWGNADVLADAYQPDQIVMGVNYHSATVIGLGHVAHTNQGPTFVGPYQQDGSLDRARAFCELLGSAGFEVSATSDIRTEIWKKLILNTATLPTAALTGLWSGTLGEFKPMLELVDALTRESVQVAQAQGLSVDLQERIDRIHSILTGAGKGKASMLQDVEAHRRTEIDTINGAVVRAAQQTGIEVPFNWAMVQLIKGVERGWEQ